MSKSPADKHEDTKRLVAAFEVDPKSKDPSELFVCLTDDANSSPADADLQDRCLRMLITVINQGQANEVAKYRGLVQSKAYSSGASEMALRAMATHAQVAAVQISACAFFSDLVRLNPEVQEKVGALGTAHIIADSLCFESQVL